MLFFIFSSRKTCKKLYLSRGISPSVSSPSSQTTFPRLSTASVYQTVSQSRPQLLLSIPLNFQNQLIFKNFQQSKMLSKMAIMFKIDRFIQNIKIMTFTEKSENVASSFPSSKNRLNLLLQLQSIQVQNASSQFPTSTEQSSRDCTALFTGRHSCSPGCSSLFFPPTFKLENSRFFQKLARR